MDGHVKVYELDTFELVHATKYPSPVLSFDCTPGATQLAVGMASGMLAVRSRPRKRRQDHPASAAAGAEGGNGGRQRWRSMLTASSYRYFLRGQNHKLTEEQLGDVTIAVAPKQKGELEALRQGHEDPGLGRPSTRAFRRGIWVVLAVLEQLCAQGAAATRFRPPCPSARRRACSPS